MVSLPISIHKNWVSDAGFPCKSNISSSLSRAPTWRTNNCDQRLLSESFFRFSIEKAQVTVCWQKCLKAETAFQIETIVWSTFGDFKIKWFARAEVLISAFVEYFLFRDNEKATDAAAVWPDWAIFKVLGDKFSYKSSANIRLLLGLLWKYHFKIKTAVVSFWAT